MNILPPFLQPRDTVAIVAPARKVSIEETAPAIRLLQSEGLEVVEGKHLYGAFNQFSGTDAERAADLQEAFDNPDIKAIWCARGGYGCARIVDMLDFSGLIKHPKWFVGFSDMTVIQSHIGRHCHIASLHAPMAFNVPAALTSEADMLKQQSAEALITYLTGKPYSIRIKDQSASMSGVITGGNLSILYSLLGSASDIDTTDKILFIEDLDEYLYHIDRMMMSLRRAGKLQNLRGLLVGGMNDMKDNAIPFGFTSEDIIRSHTAPYQYPVIFDIPAGHIPHNMPIPIGALANIQNGIITFAAA